MSQLSHFIIRLTLTQFIAVYNVEVSLSIYRRLIFISHPQFFSFVFRSKMLLMPHESINNYAKMRVTF